MTAFLAGFLFLLLLFFIVIRMFLCIVTVEGFSMLPTLVPGDQVLILRRYPHWLLRMGQIVVSDLSKADSIPSPKPTIVIKRLVGVPGSIVKFHNSQVDPCTLFAGVATLDGEGYFKMQIPHQHYFVQADGQGSDSRHWGPLPFRTLVGVVIKKMPAKGSPHQQDNIQQETLSVTSISPVDKS